MMKSATIKTALAVAIAASTAHVAYAADSTPPPTVTNASGTTTSLTNTAVINTNKAVNGDTLIVKKPTLDASALIALKDKKDLNVKVGDIVLDPKTNIAKPKVSAVPAEAPSYNLVDATPTKDKEKVYSFGEAANANNPSLKVPTVGVKPLAVAPLPTLKGIEEYKDSVNKLFDDVHTADIEANKTSIATLADTVEANKVAANTAIDANKADIAALTQTVVANRTTDNQATNNAIASANAKINQNAQDIKELDEQMKRGLATQAALTGLFQPYQVGKANLTLAVGGYKSESALAIGTGYRFNEKVATKAGVAFGTSGNSAAYNLGVNFEW
ncbi:YadA C-terminal domain-containing protein [Moraxella sp. ZJ142]|uniref:YadA C-terminal domain-containing protein n=1 Tax=Moraxella marmotae TaxID=3344520 RepID=UPI0035D5103D